MIISILIKKALEKASLKKPLQELFFYNTFPSGMSYVACKDQSAKIKII